MRFTVHCLAQYRKDFLRSMAPKSSTDALEQLRGDGEVVEGCAELALALLRGLEHLQHLQNGSTASPELRDPEHLREHFRASGAHMPGQEIWCMIR